MDIADVIAAAFLPTDGQVNPSDLALALAKGPLLELRDLPPELRHVDVEVVRLRAVVRSPDSPKNRRMGQKLSFVAGEQAQEVELRGREGHGSTVDCHGTPLEVDHEPAEVDDRLRGSIRAAQRCAQTGEELVDAERFGDVLIGVEARSAQFMTVDKPRPVVLFEYLKGLVTGERPDVGEVEKVELS